jgi:hypothetical protein
MHYSAGYFLAGMLLAQGLTLIGPPVEIETANDVASVYDPASRQQVDRVHKGDRYGSSVKTINKQPEIPKRQSIMIGCEPAFSVLTGFYTNFLGRCTT